MNAQSLLLAAAGHSSGGGGGAAAAAGARATGKGVAKVTAGVRRLVLRDTLGSAVVARAAWLWHQKRYGSGSSSSSSSSSSPSPLIVTKDEVPDWLRDNEYLETGYRQGDCTCLDSLCSCGSGSCNETFNVWSHYVGALWFWRIFFLSDKLRNTPGTSAPRFSALAAAVLFSISTGAHCFASTSRRANDVLFRVDRAAIAGFFCVLSTVCGLMHFGHRREFGYQRAYTVLCLALGVASSTAVFLGSRLPAGLKVSILAAQAALGTVAPIREYLTTTSPHIRRLVLTYLPLATGAGAAGGLIFALRIPESLGLLPPGSFLDVAGHGHNIMHVLGVLAAHFAYRGQVLWTRAIHEEHRGRRLMLSRELSRGVSKAAGR